AAFPSLIISPGATLLGAMLRKSLQRSSSENGHKRTGSKRMVAPIHGMGDLVERLEKRLEQNLGDRFRKGVRVDVLPDAPNVLLAVPAYAAADLLGVESPVLSNKLREIEYTPLVSVTAFVSRSSFTKPIKG